jgi:Domain of unknown function (DU1801)
MAETKTRETDAPVQKFISSIADQQQKEDASVLVKLIQKASGLAPKMWGTAIIGFGSRHYKYDSGREGDICLIGFSPRKQKFALYLPGGHAAYESNLKRLGKHKTAKGCLYIQRLADVDLQVLTDMMHRASTSTH